MAEERKTYPKLPRKIWWLLRDRLKQSLPTTVTPTIIQSLSDMNEGSAKSNVLAPLRELGLLGDDNKPTELASRWRDDDEYRAVCHEIRDRIYPKELVEAFPDGGSNNEKAIKGWFMRVGKVGEPAAKMYTQLYQLLSEADLTKREEQKAKPASTANRGSVQSKKVAKTTTTPPPATKAGQGELQTPTEIGDKHRPTGRFPTIHVDLQIHISPDTSAEQIDKIFESMAKHLGPVMK